MWISDPQRDVTTIGRLARHYRQCADEQGRPHRVALFREAWIGDDLAECERIWAPHALAVHRLYHNVGVYRRVYEPWVDEVAAREDFTLDRLAPGRFLYGSAADIAATVQEWSEVTGADYFALRCAPPGWAVAPADPGSDRPIRCRSDREGLTGPCLASLGTLLDRSPRVVAFSEGVHGRARSHDVTRHHDLGSRGPRRVRQRQVGETGYTGDQSVEGHRPFDT